MVAYNHELFYWKTNKEWYGIKKDGTFYLKEDAPPEAKESFEKWKKANLD